MKILMIGCSFFEETRWKFLRDFNNLDITIFGFSGFGNRRISYELSDYLSQNSPDFVIISWSGFDRDEIILEKDKAIFFPINSDNGNNKDSDNLHWYESGGFGGSAFYENQNDVFMPRYKYTFDFYPLIKTNFNYILSSQNLLKSRNIPYLFCFYSNQLENRDFSTGANATDQPLRNRYHMDFKQTRKKIKMLELIDFNKFWFYENSFSKFNGIEEFAADLNMLELDKHHATQEANKILWKKHFFPKLSF